MTTIHTSGNLQEALRRIADKVNHKATLRVGFLEGATYGDGTSVALVAAVQDFGAPSVGIPPRPFFRNMVRRRSKEWPKALGAALVQHGYDVDKSLRVLGEVIRGQLQQSIVDFEGVPLKPATVARKGFEKQLIDTSHMLNSVDYEVK